MKKISPFVKLIIKTSVYATCFLALLLINVYFPVKYVAAWINVDVFNTEGCNGDVACVHFIDVGYGDCTFMRFRDGKTALVDGGDGEYSNVLKVFALINAHGVSKIDYLFCTSVLKKRCGGLAEVINAYDVGKIFYPYCKYVYVNKSFVSFVSAARASGAMLEYLEKGKGFSGDGYFMEIMSPTSHDSPMSEYTYLNRKYSEQSANLASGILYLYCDGIKILFCGDADVDRLENLCESYLLGAFADNKLGNVVLEDCDVVKVSRCADKYSLSTTFVQLIHPKLAITSYGYKKSKYLSADVLSIVQTLEAAYCTYESTVNLIIAEDGYSVFRKE